MPTISIKIPLPSDLSNTQKLNCFVHKTKLSHPLLIEENEAKLGWVVKEE
jgi:hypothetical protein